jgi:hypothetical protein
MAVTNEALQAEIAALYKLVKQGDEHQAERLEQIAGQLEAMNGRQREQRDDIAACDKGLATLSTRVDLYAEDASKEVNRKAIYMGIISTAEALGVLIHSLLTQP